MKIGDIATVLIVPLQWVVGIFIAIIVFAIIFGKGVATAQFLIPVLTTLAGACLVIDVLIIPLCFFKRTRGIGGLIYMLSSVVIGGATTIWGLFITLALWGWAAVIIGLVFFGVGVAFVAAVASLFNGLWSQLGQIVLLLIITFGTRFLGMFLVTIYGEQIEGENMSALPSED